MWNEKKSLCLIRAALLKYTQGTMDFEEEIKKIKQESAELYMKIKVDEAIQNFLVGKDVK